MDDRNSEYQVAGFLFNVDHIPVNAFDDDFEALMTLERQVAQYVTERFESLPSYTSASTESSSAGVELLTERWTEDVEGLALVGVFVRGMTLTQAVVDQISKLLDEALAAALQGTQHVVTARTVRYFTEPCADLALQN